MSKVHHPQTWPELPYDAWEETLATLHRCGQVIGKVVLALSPPVNHYWQVALEVTSRGLRTHAVPWDGAESFEIELDLWDHVLAVRTSRGQRRGFPLRARPVAEFHDELLGLLDGLGVRPRIWECPVEIPGETTPLDQDHHHAAYDEDAVHRFWRLLHSSALVFNEFRGRFTGKASPVQFYWGSFDLAVTRFSGRVAPPRPGADVVTREAYAEEVCSAGVWAGTAELKGPAFYCYAAPEPHRFRAAEVEPAGAYYDRQLGEFVLPYGEVRGSREPRRELLAFLQSTYEAAAELGGWDRPRLERPLILPRRGATHHAPLLQEQPAP